MTSSVSTLRLIARTTTTSRTISKPLVHKFHPLATRQILNKHRNMSTSTSLNLSSVVTENAPAAIGPYSQAIKAGPFVFLSGCIPLSPSGNVVEGGIEEQTTQVLKNLKAVVEASGSRLDRVVKTTVFLKSMDDFASLNKIYSEFFGTHKPARSTVEVSRLPKDVLVEIECVAAT
ncbi:hypothetical protein BOTBODRAFT_29532 [Botryobasidium botryosum FD-172 SS1]|uniref:YjgF-like protein n=1 Tax=Botryobasidium botryosum (strain FD-172 SS1) TaxID=930990 RepID=A0A067N333_BOTB1|nr:hypothetical protein BOTBODRAFT_29532 [Botryobasidium botryosum FD-172 SS1]